MHTTRLFIVAWVVACGVASVVTFVVTSLPSSPSLQAETPGNETTPSSIVERTVWMPLSDGVRLATDLYLPATTGKHPTLLMRTPYLKGGLEKIGQYFAARGYVLAAQDCRGSGESEGEFYPYTSEGKDGYEAHEWIGRQPWFDGVLGTLGASYLGGTQWLAAAHASPHLKAMIPAATFSNFYNNLYLGGALRVDLSAGWTSGRTAPSPEIHKGLDFTRAMLHLPLVEMDTVFGWRIDMLRDWISNDVYGRPYWNALDVEDSMPEIDVPALHVVGVYDFFVADTVKSYQYMARLAKTEHARRSQKLVLGPWDHGTIGGRQVGEVDFGAEAIVDINALYKRWFDHHLRGIDNGIDREPPVDYFVAGCNEWRHASRWPPQATRQLDYFLTSGGSANTVSGDGKLGVAPATEAHEDRFVSDPAHPIPAKGGKDVEPSYVGAWGPFDQSSIEMNPNVLVYTSPALESDLEVAGPLHATLFVETDAVDTDIVVKLVDVSPTGFAVNVATGILRGRFRRSLSKPELLTPGSVTEWRVDMTHVANRFFRGHRIRVDISGSCFPLYDRNPNTGEGPRSRTARIARQRVHHSPVYRSRITLPVSVSVEKHEGSR